MYIKANAEEGVIAANIVNQLETWIKEQNYPSYINVAFGGENEEQADSMKFVSQAFIISILISIVYAIVTVVEGKFIQKKLKPTKEIIREGFFVFISSIVSLFLFFKMSGTLTEFFNIITDTKTDTVKATEVFTGEPGF